MKTYGSFKNVNFLLYLPRENCQIENYSNKNQVSQTVFSTESSTCGAFGVRVPICAYLGIRHELTCEINIRTLLVPTLWPYVLQVI
jgi:hypothetical protein